MGSEVNIHIFNECSGAHSHVYPQIMVPLQETMKIQVGDTEYEVTPQELCFVPAGMVHQCNYVGRLLTLDLSEGMNENPDAVLLNYPLIVSMRGQIMQLVELIQAELRQNPNSRSVRHLYRYLYSKLIENCAAPSIRYISEYYHPADHGGRAGENRKLQRYLLYRLVQTADRLFAELLTCAACASTKPRSCL